MKPGTFIFALEPEYSAIWNLEYSAILGSSITSAILEPDYIQLSGTQNISAILEPRIFSYTGTKKIQGQDSLKNICGKDGINLTTIRNQIFQIWPRANQSSTRSRRSRGTWNTSHERSVIDSKWIICSVCSDQYKSTSYMPTKMI